jgi:hypothetical protein
MQCTIPVRPGSNAVVNNVPRSDLSSVRFVLMLHGATLLHCPGAYN